MNLAQDTSSAPSRLFDLETANRYVVKHQPLVTHIAQNYKVDSMLREDFLQEGRLGLVIASRKFEPDRGLAFSTYATHWIRAMLLSFLLHNHGPVRVGTTRESRQAFFRLGRARQIVGDDRTAIAEYLNLPLVEIERMIVRLAKIDLRLDESYADRNDKPDLLDDAPTPEDRYAVLELRHRVREHIDHVLAKLKDRDRDILKLRWLTEPGETLQEIGDRYGFSRERARQIETKALESLRYELTNRDAAWMRG